MNTLIKHLVAKYQGNVPRYTSYPTLDRCSKKPNVGSYKNKLRLLSETGEPVSLYIHIPFCQKLCYYCACNTLIRSRDKAPTQRYLDNLGLEFETISRLAGGKLNIRQIHLGGGTPTFLTESQLDWLIHSCREYFLTSQATEISFETDPVTCTGSQLSKLRELGASRVSFGVQDFDARVQEAVNRHNSPGHVQGMVAHAREKGYKSVNLDFIYGLPHQTIDTALETVEGIAGIRPDRIAMYNFAYLPEIKKHHCLLPATELPSAEEKAFIFLGISQSLYKHGYEPVGMDHFALPDDELSIAAKTGSLMRNFMGYTPFKAPHVLGTGMTGISLLDNHYFQNASTLESYHDLLQEGLPPVIRSYGLSQTDIQCKAILDDLMCNLRIDPSAFQREFHTPFEEAFPGIGHHIRKCLQDKLLAKRLSTDSVAYSATTIGRLFLRSIASGFDHYLQEAQSTPMFSKAV